MDINGAFEGIKVITQSAFKVSEISNEDLRNKKIRDDKRLSLNPNKSYHVDSEVNGVYPASGVKGEGVSFAVLLKVRVNERDEDVERCIKFNDPKIGRNVDIER
ncbi:hypothetical protein LKV13_01340 [Borrelia sp. BU AG58]|uniref:hypothetical protein n=1 Tax=Borrelia sp. BU AG58 TaxID=2887345 RepID=UPI001E3239F9|nr:hypothetical protein [Borrelia sp. BU AG58]UER67456.1 hypothetical protein LKV13_01340 [Borrelia sp. BU AG58]